MTRKAVIPTLAVAGILGLAGITGCADGTRTVGPVGASASPSSSSGIATQSPSVTPSATATVTPSPSATATPSVTAPSGTPAPVKTKGAPTPVQTAPAPVKTSPAPVKTATVPVVTTKTVAIAHKTVTKYSSTLPKGTTKVTQVGVDGVKKLTYTDGVLTSSVVARQPVTEIIVVGTYVKPVTKRPATASVTGKSLSGGWAECRFSVYNPDGASFTFTPMVNGVAIYTDSGSAAGSIPYSAQLGNQSSVSCSFSIG